MIFEKMEKDIITVRVYPERNFTLGISSILGTRKTQEDSVYGYVQEGRVLGIVCDGMGGLEGGEVASKLAADILVQAWLAQKEIESVPAFLEEQALLADEKVFQLKNESGEVLHAGTTMVAAMVSDRELYWLSVGDSRIYLIRGGEIVSVCREHNYRLTLDELLEQGAITEEEYAKEEARAEALISYLGIGNLSLMEINRNPFLLQDQDMILLCSDGLYRSLSEDEILEIIREHQGNVQKAAQELTACALGEKKTGQDNTSVVLIQAQYKE